MNQALYLCWIGEIVGSVQFVVPMGSVPLLQGNDLRYQVSRSYLWRVKGQQGIWTMELSILPGHSASLSKQIFPIWALLQAGCIPPGVVGICFCVGRLFYSYRANRTFQILAEFSWQLWKVSFNCPPEPCGRLRQFFLGGKAGSGEEEADSDNPSHSQLSSTSKSCLLSIPGQTHESSN